MEQQPSGPSEERGAGTGLVPAGQEQPGPKVRDIYVSVWLSPEVDKRSGCRVPSILVDLTLTAAIVLIVALALAASEWAGFFLAVAMFAIIRHAQFGRVRSALARGKRA